MKRHHVLRILLCLFLGVITTFAVAWGCARWVTTSWDTSGSTDTDAQITAWLDTQSWNDAGGGPYRPVWFYDERGFGRRCAHMSATVISGRISMPAEHMLELAGWPAAALRGSSEPQWNGTTYDFVDDSLLRTSSGARVLPYGPIWPGLLANIAIYASVWWAILFGLGLLIRLRRTREGCCVKCGYDLRGAVSDVCPECGGSSSGVTSMRASQA